MRCLYKHHNISGIEDAFVKACNNYFFKRGLAEIPVKNFVRMTETFSGHAVNIANNRDYAEALAGQDKVSLSPMEGAVLAETIASGGMKPTPSLFKGDHRNMRVLSEEVAHKLREFMKQVVSEGTASSLSHLVKVGAKTGTVIQKDASGKDKTVAWMIGYAGLKEPEVAFSVVIDDAQKHGTFSGVVCSPIINSILQDFFSGEERSDVRHDGGKDDTGEADGLHEQILSRGGFMTTIVRRNVLFLSLVTAFLGIFHPTVYASDLNASLKAAVTQDNVRKVSELIANGADVDFDYGSGITPLMSAVANGYLDMVKVLLDHGASVEAKDEAGGLTPLMQAAMLGKKEMAALLIKRGAHVNSRDRNGGTALTAAALGGHINMIEMLIDKGAIVDLNDKSVEMALEIAKLTHNSQMIQVLRSAARKAKLRN